MTGRASTPNRRAFLSTAAALPFLRGGRADAATAPRRFILIRDELGFGREGGASSGPAPHRLVPPRARDAQGKPLAASALPALASVPDAREVLFQGVADLPPSLAPLRKHWQQIMVLDRFYNPFNVDLHGNGSAMYRVVPPAQLATAPTIDEAIGARLSAGMPFKVVSMSYKGDTPGRYHDRYLGAVGAGGASLLLQRRGVIEAVRSQIDRTRGRLGREDGQRLDRYLAALRENERSLESLASRQCAPVPVRSTEKLTAKYEPIKPLISHAHVDIAATALICGLTRVASLNFIPGRGPFGFFDPNPNEYNLQGALAEQAISADTRYADLVAGLRIESPATGASGNSWGLDRHDNHHAGYTECLTAIDRWEAALVARLIDRLQAAPEGDGTMWDHTLILWANSAGGVHHYGIDDHPVILIAGPKVGGPKSGAALRTGRYVSFPKKARAMSDLFVTAANAVGVELAKFGDASVCQGALPGMR